MSSVKIVLRKKKSKDGTYPLAVRITKDRKTSFVHVGKNLKESDWDKMKASVKKSYPNSQRLNIYLYQKLTEAENKLLELETDKKDVSVQAVRKKLKPSTSGTSFFSQADIFLNTMKKAGKYNRYKADEPRIRIFKEFLKEDIAFQDITIPLLNRFRAHLKGSRHLSERTVVNYLIIISTVFNQAIKEGIIDVKYYPFGKGKVRIKIPASQKIGLTAEEVKKIEELPLDKDSYFHQARNIWLFSFYFAGMRVSDVLRLKWSDFKDGRLYYTMGKNDKPGTLKTPEKALSILAQYDYKGKKGSDLVFPEIKVEDMNDSYQVQQSIAMSVLHLGKALKRVAEMAKVDKKLSMHIARHTFGNISEDRIPIKMLQKLYRHSSLTTTIGYQANFIHKDADEALDAVVNF